MDKLLFKRILIGILTALILVYVVYLFFSANFSVVRTENAVEMTVTDTVYSDGIILRNEDYVTFDGNGYVVYDLSDGDEIAVDGTVAKIYSDYDDAVKVNKIESLDEQIDELTRLTEQFYSESVGIDVMDNEINSNILAIMSDFNKNELFESSSDIHNLLNSINKRQIITGEVTDFSARIAQLEEEKQSLQNEGVKSIGTITAPRAGYFVSYMDGYEKSVDCNNLSALTVDAYENLSASSVPENAAGKIVSGLNWYVACKVSPSDALNLSLFQNSSGVTIQMPFATNEKIPAKIIEINQADTESDAVVIFQCNYMNSDLADARRETVEIGMQDFTGLRVSKSALHDDYVTVTSTDDSGNEKTEQEKVQGVYVMHGREILFKEVSIMYSDSDYVICDPEPDQGVLLSGETIKLYDKVIIEGDNIYDGKIIN